MNLETSRQIVEWLLGVLEPFQHFLKAILVDSFDCDRLVCIRRIRQFAITIEKSCNDFAVLVVFIVGPMKDAVSVMMPELDRAVWPIASMIATELIVYYETDFFQMFFVVVVVFGEPLDDMKCCLLVVLDIFNGSFDH